MNHQSTFDLMIGNACITQFDVMAEIKRDSADEWYVAGIYADAIEKDGKRCTNSRDWERIPGTHPLYQQIMLHFLKGCRDEISDRWERHGWRYEPRDFYVNQAGRVTA